MKSVKITFVLFLIIQSIICFADKVTKEKAQKIAITWGNSRFKSNSKIDKQTEFIYKNDTTLYIINFNDTGFVIIPSDDNSYPVLAYSKDGKFEMEKMSPYQKSWLDYYSEMIIIERKLEKNKSIKGKWDELENGASLKSVQSTVPSLFESTGSSRWSYWRPYFNQAPAAQNNFCEGWNCCVPLVLSQLMKYYKYPLIGTGSESYSYDGISISENFNYIFNYNIMPFRLTHCCMGSYNCTDADWDIIEGITQQQKNEVGELQYLAGVGVETHWLANRDTSRTSGTFGTTNSFAQSLVDHFYFSSDYSYWNSTTIQNNTAGFKQAVRNSLNNSRPVLFRYDCHINGGGHIVVIDGYENDEFFHFITGQGGYEDAYYYLFSSDNDGVHLPRPHINLWGLESVVNLHPDCPSNQDVTLSNITVSDGEGRLIQSGNNLTINNFTINNGGAAVLRGSNTISIPSSFEVKLGGEVFIVSKPCSN